jgi:hypothetical protein
VQGLCDGQLSTPAFCVHHLLCWVVVVFLISMLFVSWACVSTYVFVPTNLCVCTCEVVCRMCCAVLCVKDGTGVGWGLKHN